VGPREPFSVVEDGAAYRTLLVDDQADLRRILRMGISRETRLHVVGEAADGVEALAIARAQKPDLIVLDVGMPRMDGLDALPLLKQACPDARIVVLSAYAEGIVGEAALALGANAYFEKGARMRDVVPRLLEIARQPPAAPRPEQDALVERARLFLP